MGIAAEAPRKRRTLFLVGGGLVVVAGLVVLVWFQPQRIFMNDTVSEGLPGSSDSGSVDSAAGGGGGADLTTTAQGDFAGLAHDVQGEAMVLETKDGELFLRFEDFEVENGPDLRVYLSAAGEGGDYGADFVDLGGLKGNIGDQNYSIPESTDVTKYRSAVIWCRRFSVAFAVADLK